jgi:hypothetical protein
MRQDECLLNKRVSVKSIGAVAGGAFLIAVVSGLLWHRRTIKRLIEIRQT